MRVAACLCDNSSSKDRPAGRYRTKSSGHQQPYLHHERETMANPLPTSGYSVGFTGYRPSQPVPRGNRVQPPATHMYGLGKVDQTFSNYSASIICCNGFCLSESFSAFFYRVKVSHKLLAEDEPLEKLKGREVVARMFLRHMRCNPSDSIS